MFCATAHRGPTRSLRGGPARRRRSWAAAVPTALAIVLAAGLLPGPPGALGFGTVNGRGTPQQAEHERITRAALACTGSSSGLCFEPRTIAQLAGERGTSGAVGSPDADEIFNGAAHCDSADFLDRPGYPQSRAAATAELNSCRAHLRGRFEQAVRAAERLLDDKGRIKPSEVRLTSSCTFVGGASGRAKCDVLEGLGRALHGVEDFYSHSNWADVADPSHGISIDNPPGLGNAGVAPVMSLRSTAAAAVPRDLATGCFSLVPLGCRRRITHGTLNKDNGLIDPRTGATSGPRTERGRVDTNFARAVAGAIAEARRQWSDLSAELVSRYGARRGNLMICALTRDDPLKDCTGRRIVIVIDSSGSNQETDPSNLRIAAGRAVNESLISEAEARDDEQPDQSAVVQFDTSASVISPLADPSLANFAGIDSEGGTDIGAGVSLAISLLTADPNAPVKDRTGIVVLTDGEDGGNSLPGALGQAAALGIRVNFGFLSAPGTFRTRTPAARRDTRAGTEARRAFTPDSALVRLIAATGGVYSVIDGAENQQGFADLVQRGGLTNMEDPNGTGSGGPLAPSVSSTGVLDGPAATATHEFSTRPWRPVSFSANPLDGQQLRLVARDVETGAVVASADASVAGAPVSVSSVAMGGRFQVDVTSVAGAGAYEISVAETGADLLGTSSADRLRCGAEPTYVEAGAHADNVRCGPADDALVGGRGADRLNAGSGNDLIVVGKRDLARGTERIAGGSGTDRVLFLFARPEGVQCRRGTTEAVEVQRGKRVKLAQVEHVSFMYSACGASRVPSPSLSPLGSNQGRADFGVRPPRPRPRITNVTRTRVDVVVRVARATAVAAGGRVRTSRGPVDLEAVSTMAERAGTVRLKLKLPDELRRTSRNRTPSLRLVVVTSGLGGAMTKTSTIVARLRR